MAKLKSEEEPTAEIPIELHENLVRQTLKMNPSLAGDMDAETFIKEQTGKFNAVSRQQMQEEAERTEPGRPSMTVRSLNSFFEEERKKLGQTMAEIRRQKEALDKEAATARRLVVSTLVRHLAANLRSTEDFKEVLEVNQVFLEELAVSEKDLIKRTTELMRKLRT